MVWQAVALLPFIDERRLLDAMGTKYPGLSEEEQKRNKWGANVVFVSDTHPLYPTLEALYGKRKSTEVRPWPRSLFLRAHKTLLANGNRSIEQFWLQWQFTSGSLLYSVLDVLRPVRRRRSARHPREPHTLRTLLFPQAADSASLYPTSWGENASAPAYALGPRSCTTAVQRQGPSYGRRVLFL